MLTRSQIDKKFETMACERASKSRQPPTPGHAAAEGALTGEHEHTPMCYGDNDDGTYPGERETDEEFARRQRLERIQHEVNPAVDDQAGADLDKRGLRRLRDGAGTPGGKMAGELSRRGLNVSEPGVGKAAPAELGKVYSDADGCSPEAVSDYGHPEPMDLDRASLGPGHDGPHVTRIPSGLMNAATIRRSNLDGESPRRG